MPDLEEHSEEEESSEDTTEDMDEEPYAWKRIVL